MFGIAVLGYDTSLPEDEIESKLTANFSSCGKITHVFVCPLDECTNIYFSKEEGEASALDLNGSEVGGFKITTMRVATVRSNPPLAPGETRIGYSIPGTSNLFLDSLFSRLINLLMNSSLLFMQLILSSLPARTRRSSMII